MLTFLSGLLVGSSVSLLTVVVLKIFDTDKLLDNQEYKIEIKSGHNYRSGVVKFSKIKHKRGSKK